MGKKNLNPKNIEEISGVDLKSEHDFLDNLFDNLSGEIYPIEDSKVVENELDKRIKNLKSAKRKIKKEKKKL